MAAISDTEILITVKTCMFHVSSSFKMGNFVTNIKIVIQNEAFLKFIIVARTNMKEWYQEVLFLPMTGYSILEKLQRIQQKMHNKSIASPSFTVPILL